MNKINLLLVTICGLFVFSQSCTKPPQVQPDHSVLLSFDTVTLVAGYSKQLTSKDYTADQLTWTSSDSTVAAVDKGGIITAYKSGSTTITVTAKQYNVAATCTVKVVDAMVTDVGAGADGSVFAVGADSLESGGHSLFQIINNQFHKLPACAAVRVSVSPQGVPWVVTASHTILKYNGTAWDQLPGLATDIGIGANGSVFAIGTVSASPTGGYNIMKWNGTSWDTMPDCAGIHIAVDPAGTPWVVNKSKLVFRFGGVYLWDTLYGVTGNDITLDANGVAFVSGIGDPADSNVPAIFQFDHSMWLKLTGTSNATNLAAGTNGKLWWVDSANILHSN